MIARIALAIAFCIGLFGLGYFRGEKSKQSEIDAMILSKEIANATLELRNKQIDDIQKRLDSTISNLNASGVDNAKAHAENDQLRSDLSANRKRLLVAISKRDSTKTSSYSTIAGMGAQSTVTAELDPTVASNLVQLTDTGDQAIRRLNACIAAYDAVLNAK